MFKGDPTKTMHLIATSIYKQMGDIGLVRVCGT